MSISVDDIKPQLSVRNDQNILPIDIISTRTCSPTSSDMSDARQPVINVARRGVPKRGWISPKNLCAELKI